MSPKGFPPRSKSPISNESGECFYFARGTRTRGDKCPYKHIKHSAPVESTPAAASTVRKSVSFGDTETCIITSSFPDPSFGPVVRERNLSYSWPEDIRGLNSTRERRRAHMMAVLRREQVLLDDVNARE